ncbi:hypothetical protein SLA2020_505920 [Shorea laevis]
MLELEVEQNGGEEEDDDEVTSRLGVQEVNVQDELRHMDEVASLACKTSAAMMVGQQNQQKDDDGATAEDESVTSGSAEKQEGAEENSTEVSEDTDHSMLKLEA